VRATEASGIGDSAERQPRAARVSHAHPRGIT
jgi:hypothetical protein